jgi:hypothetical protein
MTALQGISMPWPPMYIWFWNKDYKFYTGVKIEHSIFYICIHFLFWASCSYFQAKLVNLGNISLTSVLKFKSLRFFSSLLPEFHLFTLDSDAMTCLWESAHILVRVTACSIGFYWCGIVLNQPTGPVISFNCGYLRGAHLHLIPAKGNWVFSTMSYFLVPNQLFS